MPGYFEDDQLTRYVWRNYPRFLTETEKLADRAIIVEMKAGNSKSPRFAEMLRQKFGRRDNPDVVAALSEGCDSFYRRTRERVMRAHGEQIFINRCPKCNCIVESPTACLCKWCHHTWFDRRKELEGIFRERLAGRNASNEPGEPVNEESLQGE